MRVGLPTVSACMVFWCLVAPAAGQPSRHVGIKAPGRLRGVGRSEATSTFRSWSYGLGSLGSGGYGAPTGVLRSTIGEQGYSLRSSLSAPFSSPLRSSIATSPLAQRLGGRRGAVPNVGSARPPLATGRAPRVPITGASGATVGTGTAAIPDPVFGLAKRYMRAVGSSGLTARGADNKVITSLVPSQPSEYARLLAKGEEAFKRGQVSSRDFAVALNYFERASYIAPRTPESLLSLTHGRFATSSVAYATAGHYLRRTLECLPELPLAPLKPKLFYGSDSAAAARYVRHLARLEKHLTNVPDDVDALLLLAYFRWFSGRTGETKVALAKAMKISLEDRDREMAEAVETFWTAMVLSGKASGELLEATTPKNNPKSAAAP